MRNLYRKSIKIVTVALGLLFLFNCKTVPVVPEFDITPPLSLEEMFPEERENLVYINRAQNDSIITIFTEDLELNSSSKNMFEKSSNIYMAFNGDFSEGIDIIITGNYSKWQSNLGLFFSRGWKRVREGGYKIWQSREGIQLYFINDNMVLISTFNVIDLISIVEGRVPEIPEDSLQFIIPELDDETVQNLTAGFIKGGILDLGIYLNRIESGYDLKAVLGFDSESKARAFSRLLNIFIRILINQSSNADILKIGSDFQLKAENSEVLVENITINDKIMVDMLYNVILLDGEAK